MVLLWIALLAVGGVIIYKTRFAPAPVTAHQVTSAEIVGEVMGTGTLEARVKTTVSARIQERLREVHVDQGDTVKQGQLLARLDDAEARQHVAIAQATLEAAQKTAARVRADLARAEAVLAQAQLDERRLRGLAAAQAAAQSDADKAAERLGIAEADLKRSQATIAESESQILVAEKNLLYRQEQLAFTVIHAPYDGLIIRRDREPGDMLVPGASLLQLVSLGELWISAWVDETAMPALKAEQKARVAFRSEPERTFAGVVSRLGRESDRETREFLVDVRVTELPENWTIGQRAEVFIETGQERNAVVLPAAFVARRQGRTGVFVYQNGKAHWQELSLGLSGRGLIAVTNGLRAGATVVRMPEGEKTPLTEGRRIALP